MKIILIIYVVFVLLELIHTFVRMSHNRSRDLFSKIVDFLWLVVADLIPIFNIFTSLLRISSSIYLVSWYLKSDDFYRKNKLLHILQQNPDLQVYIDMVEKDVKNFPSLIYHLGGRKEDNDSWDSYHPVGVENWIAVGISKLIVLNK